MTALLDGELTSAESKVVESHVSSCADCRAELESLRYSFRLTDTVAKSHAINPPRWSRIETEIGQPTRPWWDLGRLMELAWAPALVAVLLLAIYLVPGFWSRPRQQAEPLEQMLSAYVQERDQQETIHEGIFHTEPVGWVYYNPYSVNEQRAGKNPYASE